MFHRLKDAAGKTQKTPVVAIVQRPADGTPGSIAGDARAALVTGLSLRAAVGAIAPQVELQAHLMSDEAKAFMAIGESFAAHETVNHSSREYVRDTAHVNSVEGLTLGSAEPSQVFFIISARNLPLYISMRSASVGPSALSLAKLCGKAEMVRKA